MRRSTSVVLLLFACAACSTTSVDDASEKAVVLEGPYLGQAAPGSEPELFAPGLVSTGMHTRDMAMSPEGDEIYFSIQAGPLVTILGSRLVDGVWTEPEVADFSSDPPWAISSRTSRRTAAASSSSRTDWRMAALYRRPSAGAGSAPTSG